MRRFERYICFCLLFVTFISCNDDKNSVAPSGTLYLNVDQDKTVLTKAQTPVTDESLRVDIISVSGDTVKSYNDYLKEVKDQKLILPVGNYTVSVTSNHTGKAGWETPFYAGSTEAEIKAGEIKAVKVICKISNTKVKVEYADELSDYFIDYQTVVSNSSGSLLYVRDEYRAGYFAPDKLTANLSLVNKDGNTFTMQRVFQNVKEQTFYKIRFYINDEDSDQSGADFGDVTVDEKADTVYCNIFIKEESLTGKGVPALSLTGDFKENAITYKKENTVVSSGALKIEALNGIERMEVKVNSKQFAALGITSFDLCDLSEPIRAKLASLNFPTPSDVKGKTALELSFDEEFTKALDTETATTVGTHTFTVYVMDKLHQEKEIQFVYKIRPNVKVTTENPIVWAKFVVLKGNAGDKEGVAFMFKKVGDADYKEYKVDPSLFDEESGNYSMLLTEGIEPNTKYTYYAVAGSGDRDKDVEFTTNETPTIPNLSFDEWCKVDGIIYPNKDLTDANHFWDSGNGGAVKAKKTPTESTTDAVKGTAVYMHSEMATMMGIGAFAAGNIYTGRFNAAIMDIANPGAKLDFGQPYSGRPTKLTGYYKYQPVAVNHGGYGELTSGKMDKCTIYIAICKWSSRFSVNTQSGTFVNLNSSDIIALGELSDKEASATGMTSYKPFEIDIKYRKGKITTEPTYVLIVASASKYGDYFTGGEGSKLFIDEFSLSFDYNPASFEGTELEKYK